MGSACGWIPARTLTRALLDVMMGGVAGDMSGFRSAVPGCSDLLRRGMGGVRAASRGRGPDPDPEMGLPSAADVGEPPCPPSPPPAVPSLLARAMAGLCVASDLRTNPCTPPPAPAPPPVPGVPAPLAPKRPGDRYAVAACSLSSSSNSTSCRRVRRTVVPRKGAIMPNTSSCARASTWGELPVGSRRPNVTPASASWTSSRTTPTSVHTTGTPANPASSTDCGNVPRWPANSTSQAWDTTRPMEGAGPSRSTLF
mmetsp:Transcript_8011/g.25123  ORF Transcript_8011/g.25123 Transcript_8011/m.25123 type:complete len:255 (-) Transcript_8011:1005-1769(-)